MTLRVEVSRQTAEEADDIYFWIASHTKAGADRWSEAYLAALQDLPRTAPDAGLAEEASRLGIDLRERSFKTRRGRVYRLVFLMRDEVIHVISVRGAGQDWLTWDEIDLPS